MGGNRLSDRLLNNLNWLLVLNDWLLNNLRLLVNHLSFDRVVLNSFLIPIDWHVLDDLVVGHLGNVLSLIFNSVVVSDVLFSGDLHSLPYFFVFHYTSLVGNVLNSAFSLDGLLLYDNLLVNHRLGNDLLSHHRLSNHLLWDILWLNNSLGHHRSLLEDGLLVILGCLCVDLRGHHR